jgi:ankyrin repeat protein
VLLFVEGWMLFALQWIDKEGKTPLMVASMRPDLINVVQVLIELGANVNAYRPGISTALIQLISALFFVPCVIDKKMVCPNSADWRSLVRCF